MNEIRDRLLCVVVAGAVLFALPASAQDVESARPPVAPVDSSTSEERDEPAQDPEAEEEKPTFAEALSGGRAAVNLRYRFEFVDEDNRALDGRASTLRTTLAYGTRPFHGFRVYLQAENVTNVGFANEHNNRGFGDSANGVTDRPVIADPPGTEMLQAYLEYATGDSTLQLGRQVVNLDDQRHVGAVGWRQHWQSHDAIRFRNTSLGNLTFNYAFLDRVHRIFRDKLETSTHLLNAQWKFEDVGTLTGYGYLLRYDDDANGNLSRDTFGAEFKGSRPAGDVTLHYEVEYAHQSAAGNNPRRVSADYVHLVGGVGYRKFTFRVGWEKLSGSAPDGQFLFVLGTNHAFNGWVDKFLSTPTNGLQDLLFRLDGPLGPLSWQLRYHDFRASTGGVRYGSELDFLVSYTAPWRQSFALKGGVYDADRFSADTTKLWLYTAYSF